MCKVGYQYARVIEHDAGVLLLLLAIRDPRSAIDVGVGPTFRARQPACLADVEAR